MPDRSTRACFVDVDTNVYLCQLIYNFYSINATGYCLTCTFYT